jgi:hypothetical protein
MQPRLTYRHVASTVYLSGFAQRSTRVAYAYAMSVNVLGARRGSQREPRSPERAERAEAGTDVIRRVPYPHL